VLWCLCQQQTELSEAAYRGHLAHPVAPLVQACLRENPSERPSALQIVYALEQHIPHAQPVLVKLTQRLGLLAHRHQHTLQKRLEPFATPETVTDIEGYWLRFKEGLNPDKKAEHAPQPLHRAIAQFLQSPEKTMTLTALGGMGKSLSAYAFVQQIFLIFGKR
jgi:hypothetical protein